MSWTIRKSLTPHSRQINMLVLVTINTAALLLLLLLLLPFYGLLDYIQDYPGKLVPYS